MFPPGLQLPCIPPRAKLITVGLPVRSTAIPFLTADKIIKRSLRLDRECCSLLLLHCVIVPVAAREHAPIFTCETLQLFVGSNERTVTMRNEQCWC
jgi:hypothetical protein